MSREKSRLTPDIINALGNFLRALTSETITEDIIRTVCRNTGIAAVGQGELSAWLKEFRKTVAAPQDKLLILADIIPEGLLMALLLVAQEFVYAQVTKVYQADVQANMLFQSKMVVLENDMADALTAVNATEAKCANLTMELDTKQKMVSNLTEINMALEKEASLLRGMLQERKEANQRKTTVKVRTPRVRALKAPLATKNRPQKVPEETQSITP